MCTCVCVRERAWSPGDDCVVRGGRAHRVGCRRNVLAKAKAVLEGGNGDAEVPSGPKPPATPPPNGPKGLGKAPAAPEGKTVYVDIARYKSQQLCLFLFVSLALSLSVPLPLSVFISLLL